MASRNNVVRLIDIGIVAGGVVALSLLVAFLWVVRYSDARLTSGEARIVEDAFQRTLTVFEERLPTEKPENWVAARADQRAIARLVGVGDMVVSPHGDVSSLFKTPDAHRALMVSLNALAEAGQRGNRIAFLLTTHQNPTLVLLGALDADDSGASPAYAIELFDFDGFALDVARFGIVVSAIRPAFGAEVTHLSRLPITAMSGNTLAEIIWEGQRISPISYRIVLPVLVVTTLLMLIALAVLRGLWRDAWERLLGELREAHLRSLTDQLTGLPNRRALFEHLSRVAPEMGKPEKITVLVLDLDGFKLINDGQGHQIGDELIRQAAAIFREIFQAAGFVARLGGDEFVVVLGDTLSENALQRVYRTITERFAEQARFNRNFQKVGVSIGAVNTADQPLGGDGLIRLADIALFAAKGRGRGLALMYHPDMRSNEAHTRMMERELRAGLLTGELFLHHQPIVDALGGQCIGHESLVRWRHPVRGIIPPGQFIPLAEKSDLIVQIGNFVLEKALAELGPVNDLSISVNVTGRQILSAGFADFVERSLLRFSVPASRLCLEVTETSLVDDGDGVVAVMERLQALGVRFAIDDFGIGYSSLGYLLRFRFDVLKIDRDFIAALEAKPESPMIVMSIVSLARSLGMRVVGEGVETTSQHRFLASAGCNALQGYLFGRPEPISEVQTRLQPEQASPGTSIAA